MFQCLYTFNELNSEYLNSLNLSPDGIFLVGCFHNRVKVLDLTTGNINHSFELRGDRYGHYNTLVNPDWKTIISNDGYGNLRNYDLWTGEEVFSFQEDNTALAFSPDGKVLFSATSKGRHDSNARIEINVIEFSTRQLLRTLLFANGYLPVRRLLLSPDGSILVAQTFHILTQVWDWQNGQVMSVFNALPTSSSLDLGNCVCRHWLDAVATRPNSQIIAAVAQRDKPNEQTTVGIWDLQTAEALYTLGISQREPHSGMPHSAMTPDGSLLAVGNINSIEIWDLESRQQFCVLDGHQSRIDYLTISPDGKIIISHASGDSIKVWHSNGTC
ncbi:MAG: putative serine/threonine-protein kinase PkwA (plasmid) [Chroococcopsis gigantea SAG 12.99]|jgi:WD40 repeat protein|nr:putative serine/threonine-protein kinase PkwA [Chroococcopsis gigantea SAG 12.99]